MNQSEEDRFYGRVSEIEALAKQQGLDFFPTSFEVVPQDIMTEVAAYGLPTRARHWSYGKVYQHQHLYGTMGLSTIYEIVLNNDPGLAFLLDTNPEIANLLVAAHVFGHVDFFKNNALFTPTNRNMVNDAVSHALRIDRYIERHGLDAVEHFMDIGFALDRHLDPHKGTARQRYPERRIVEKERPRREYDDLFQNSAPSIIYVVEGVRMPPHPEHDLLWFLKEYAPLEEWQKDVLEIIREESYYFYPQFMTKIMNEGWASYWHAELFHLYKGITPGEMIEFASLHAGVVNPGGRYGVNPYYLGYTILVDIEKRWNKMQEEWDKNVQEGKPQENKGRSRPMSGREKLFEVRSSEDDISFLRNYLTVELVEKLRLFSYGSNCKHPPGQKCPQCEDIVITSRERNTVVESLITSKYNYGVPRIVVKEVINGNLYLEHLDWKESFLDRKFTTQTLAYIAELWKHPVSLLISDEKGQDVTLSAKPS